MLCSDALSGYQDLCDPWPEALIAGLEFFDERGIAAIRAFYAEELREFSQLQVRELIGMDLQREIRKAVASRTRRL